LPEFTRRHSVSDKLDLLGPLPVEQLTDHAIVNNIAGCRGKNTALFSSPPGNVPQLTSESPNFEFSEAKANSRAPWLRRVHRIGLNRDTGRAETGFSLLSFDACRLDDWPPLLDFSFLKDRERLWRLLLARENLLANSCKPVLHCRIGQSFYDG
jgi:hypothetical protein